MPCIKGLVLRHGYVQCPPLCKQTLQSKHGGKGSIPLPRAHLLCPPLLTKLQLFGASSVAICNCTCLTWRRASRQIVNAIAIFMVMQAVLVAGTKLKQIGSLSVNCQLQFLACRTSLHCIYTVVTFPFGLFKGRLTKVVLRPPEATMSHVGFQEIIKKLSKNEQ